MTNKAAYKSGLETNLGRFAWKVLSTLSEHLNTVESAQRNVTVLEEGRLHYGRALEIIQLVADIELRARALEHQAPLDNDRWREAEKLVEDLEDIPVDDQKELEALSEHFRRETPNPCVECGHLPEWNHGRFLLDPHQYSLRCPARGSDLLGPFNTAQEAIEAWNRVNPIAKEDTTVAERADDTDEQDIFDRSSFCINLCSDCGEMPQWGMLDGEFFLDCPTSCKDSGKLGSQLEVMDAWNRANPIAKEEKIDDL